MALSEMKWSKAYSQFDMDFIFKGLLAQEDRTFTFMSQLQWCNIYKKSKLLQSSTYLRFIMYK